MLFVNCFEFKYFKSIFKMKIKSTARFKFLNLNQWNINYSTCNVVILENKLFRGFKFNYFLRNSGNYALGF